MILMIVVDFLIACGDPLAPENSYENIVCIALLSA